MFCKFTLVHENFHSLEIIATVVHSLPGASPPADVVAVQDGVTAINVSWTPPSPLGYTTGYQINYTSGEGSGGSVDVNGGNIKSFLVTGLVREATYIISITATSEYLPSTTVTVNPIKLGEFSRGCMVVLISMCTSSPTSPVLPPSAPPVVDMESGAGSSSTTFTHSTTDG